MTQQISWLHLSDLHLRTGDQYDQQIAVSSLHEDLIKLVEQGGQNFDAIFVTGDIAYSGRMEEYEVATKFFRELSSATSVPMGRIYCVPGNHDIDRSRLTSFLVESSRTLRSRELVNQVIGKANERSLFTDRQLPYYNFLKKTFPWATNITPSDLSYTQTLKLKDKRLGVLGLNSSWVAGSDDDRGRIVVGERQVREALEKTAGADLVVGLLHHPFSWLSDFDATDVTFLLNSRCDFLLHGHIHDFGMVNLVSPDSAAFHLAAGATYRGRHELLSYNFVSLNIEDGHGQVTIRQYSDYNGGFWGPATGFYRSAPSGIISLEIPERLSHRAQPPSLSALNEQLSKLVSETTLSEVPTEPLPSVPRVPPALVKEIRAGRCILFAGAGTSVDAKLPCWSELLSSMIERADDSGTLSDSERSELKSLFDRGEYMVVAAFCRDKLGVYEFAEHLHSQLSDSSRASRTHRILAEIPFRAAITTNFDTFIEHSRKRAQVVLPDMMETLGADGVEALLQDPDIFPVIKMHGTAIDVSSIVLTRGDFRNVLFKKPKYREFLRRLFIDSTVFFYGYSFRDLNVDFLLQDIMASYSGNVRPHYALLPNPGVIAMRYWFEDFNIRVIPYDLWKGSHVVSTAFLQELLEQIQR